MKTIEQLDAMSIEEQWKYFGTPENNEFEIRMSKERATYCAKDYPELYENKIIHDMGCGYGVAAKFLAENFKCTVVGIEAHDVALKICNEQNKHPKITYAKGLVSKTNLPSESADIVHVVEVIEHLTMDERDLAIKEWRRLLKPEGLLYITTPELRGRKEEFPKGSHVTEYEFDELKEILSKEGFKLCWFKRKYQTDEISMALMFEKVSK